MDPATVLKAGSSLISHRVRQRPRLGRHLAFLCLALSLHPGLSVFPSFVFPCLYCPTQFPS